MQNEPTVRLTAVRRLYEVSARMGAGRSLSETLQAVVDGVVDGLGFGIAVLNLRQPDGKFEVIAVAGSPEAREALLGTISAADIFDAEFEIADKWGGLRFVPHERLPEGEVIGWVPDVPVSTEPDAWHPLDALFAPLHSPDGELVGMLSVDLPEDQRRPGPDPPRAAGDLRHPGRAGDRQGPADGSAAGREGPAGGERDDVPAGVRGRRQRDGDDRLRRAGGRPGTAGQRRLLPDHRLHPRPAGRDRLSWTTCRDEDPEPDPAGDRADSAPARARTGSSGPSGGPTATTSGSAARR